MTDAEIVALSTKIKGQNRKEKKAVRGQQLVPLLVELKTQSGKEEEPAVIPTHRTVDGEGEVFSSFVLQGVGMRLKELGGVKERKQAQVSTEARVDAENSVHHVMRQVAGCMYITRCQDENPRLYRCVNNFDSMGVSFNPMSHELHLQKSVFYLKQKIEVDTDQKLEPIMAEKQKNEKNAWVTHKVCVNFNAAGDVTCLVFVVRDKRLEADDFYCEELPQRLGNGTRAYLCMNKTGGLPAKQFKRVLLDCIIPSFVQVDSKCGVALSVDGDPSQQGSFFDTDVLKVLVEKGIDVLESSANATAVHQPADKNKKNFRLVRLTVKTGINVIKPSGKGGGNTLRQFLEGLRKKAPWKTYDRGRMESVISFLLTVQEHHSRIWDVKSARDSFLATAQHPSLSPLQMLDNLLKARRGPDLSNRVYGILKSKVDTCYKKFREKGKLTKTILDLRALHHTGTVLLTHVAIVDRYLNKEEREAEEKELAKFMSFFVCLL